MQEQEQEIKKLINYIEKNSLKDMRGGDLQKLLTQHFPNWESLVKDPKNWPLIEKETPPSSGLCHAFARGAGAGLVVRWFDSKVENQREAARDWLEDFGESPTPEIWKELSEEAKEYVIHHTFHRWPGEPFEIYEDFARSIGHLAHELHHHHPSSIPGIQLTLPPTIGYVPPFRILQLRAVIQRADDKRSLKVVEDMIKERKEAAEKSSSSLLYTSRIPYNPTRDERELIACVMDKFRANGYMASVLPEIYLSFEPPPLFVAYPELEEEIEAHEGEQQQRESRTRRNKERGRPETISIEEVLGCYISNPQIILYQRGLKWCARRYKFDEKLLRGIVLTHEIGHWVTHLLPKPDITFWPTELYKLTSMEVHEGWAQLITWWIVDEIGEEIKQVFEDLNRLQSPAYRVYENFKSKSITSVINSLEMLRQLRWPAGIIDWQRFIK